eukprot:m.131116 g.131116  ORF g.131116 m.131116 type:complete len:1605 (-) comp16808_c2_seq1:2450-7264(-)
MGQALSREQLLGALRDDLGLSDKHALPVPAALSFGVQPKDKHDVAPAPEVTTTSVCLVPRQWLQAVSSADQGFVRLDDPVWEGDALQELSELEAQLRLQRTHADLPVESPFCRVAIDVVAKTTVVSALGKPTDRVPSSSFVDFLCRTSADHQAHYYASVVGVQGTAAKDTKDPSHHRGIIDVGHLKRVIQRLRVTVPVWQVATPLPSDKLSDSCAQAHAATSPSVLPPPLHGCHPNLASVHCIIEGTDAFFVVRPNQRFTLRDVTRFSPGMLSESLTKPLFIVYQVVHGLHSLHEQGIAHAAVLPEAVDVEQNLWAHLRPPRLVAFDASPSAPDQRLDWLVDSWSSGCISNFQYLMALNRLAGRRRGDPNNHPVLPWIMDFSQRDGGWRDLSKTKFRLAKGDEQLDITFGGPTPHHISDILSEVTYFVYLARRVPRDRLCMHVRSKWVPNEYPSSMQRMYHWSPDECIPEFFTDSKIFSSTHDDLSDLEIPSWASSPEEFVQLHMKALESDWVSQHLHAWIDLTFGYKLAGEAAVQDKNVCLDLVGPRKVLKNHGVVQLFVGPHPRKTPVLTPYDVPKKLAHLTALVSQAGSRRADKGKTHLLSELLSKASSLGSDGQRGSFADSRIRKPKSASKLPPTQPFAEDAPDLETPSQQSPPPAAPAATATAAVRVLDSKITLPADWDPLRALLHEEDRHVFASQSCGPQHQQPTGKQASRRGETPLQRDAAALGCLVAELFLQDSDSAKTLACARTLAGSRISEELCSLYRQHGHALPSCVRRGVLALLDADPLARPTMNELLAVHRADLLLSFPSYFGALHQLLSELRSCPLEKKPFVVRKWRVELMQFQDAGFQIVLPELVHLFNNPVSGIGALDVFDTLSIRLGRQKTRQLLLQPLTRLHDTDRDDLMIKLVSHHVLTRLVERFGLAVYVDSFLPFVIDATCSPSAEVARHAALALSWLVPRFGPVLTVRRLVRPLRRKVVNPAPNFSMQVLGKVTAVCGEKVVDDLVLPFVIKKVASHTDQPTAKSESVLLNCTVLLKYTLGVLSTESLGERFESLATSLFQRLFRTVAAHCGNPERPKNAVLCRRTVDLLIQLSRQMGRDQSRELMLPLLQEFFSCFAIYTESGELKSDSGTSPCPGGSNAQLEALYSRTLACHAYSNFCQLIGQETMRRELSNSTILEHLLYSDLEQSEQVGAWADEPALPSDTPEFVYTTTVTGADSSDAASADTSTDAVRATSPENFFLEYEKVELEKEGRSEFDSLTAPAIKSSHPAHRDDLQVNWGDYWSGQCQTTHPNPAFEFRDLCIGRFQAHSAGIRCMYAFDNETRLLSGSKDKVARLWSLHHHCQAQEMVATCAIAYHGHRKTVQSILYCANLRCVASSDGVVNVWDPENSHTTHQYDLRKSATIVLDQVPSRSALVAATEAGTLRFLDLRSYAIMHEWRAHSFPGGAIRCLVVGPEENWVAYGFATGHVTVLDIRTGLIQNRWRAHDGDVLQLQPLSDTLLVSSSTDHTVATWDVSTASLVSRIKVHGDPVTSLVACGNQLVSVGASNRLAVHSACDSKEPVSSGLTKIRHPKSSVTCVAALPLHQLLVCGSESGSAVVYA